MPYHRSQILLEQNQYEALSRIAKETHRSISEVARELIGEGIASIGRRREDAVEALEQLTSLRGRIEARTGVLGYDPVAAAREDRESELP